VSDDPSVWFRFSWDLQAGRFDVAPPPGYHVREASVADREALVRLALEAYGSDATWDPILGNIETRLTARIRATLGTPGVAYFVAEMAGDIAALSAASLVRHDGHNLITGTCVARAHQGKGLGRVVLGACLAWLKAQGLAEAQVFTDPRAVAARHVYPAFGARRENAPDYRAPERG